MDSTASTTCKSTRKRKETLKVREKDDCIPITTEPLPKKVQVLVELLLPEFEPLSRVTYEI